MPSPSMASRAFTAMLTSAVSNWLRSARTKQATSGTVERAAKLTGQLLSFARRQALKAEVFDVVACLRGRADDGEKVVEVVRHAPGQLTDGLHLLGLPQGLFSPGSSSRSRGGKRSRRKSSTSSRACGAWRRCSIPAQEVDRRADDGEKVVEVVRHAPGQLTDGLHLLGFSRTATATGTARRAGSPGTRPPRATSSTPTGATSVTTSSSGQMNSWKLRPTTSAGSWPRIAFQAGFTAGWHSAGRHRGARPGGGA
jgi:hypothetical protein